jgi:hypothetical protein
MALRLGNDPRRAGRMRGIRWAVRFGLLSGGLAIAVAGARAQALPRSRDYLFVTNVDDARALWVNPAGLGWVPEASVLAEAVLDRAEGTARWSQYSFGLNSRGLALAYWRSRRPAGPGQGVWTVGLGLPLGPGAIGASLSSYRGRGATGYDVGLRYPLAWGADLGLVLRNLGRPAIDSLAEPISGVVGLTVPVAPGLAELSLEGRAVERRAAEGYEFSYRAGFTLQAVGAVGLHAAADVAGSRLRQWSLGLVLGGLDRLGAVMSSLPATGLGEPQRFSAVGLASRRPRAAAR